MGGHLKLTELSDALKRRRQIDDLSLEDVRIQTGVSKSTLSRIERSIGIPDSETISILTGWLNMPVARVVDNCDEVCPVIYYENESTPDIVEAHLKQDKRLTPNAAVALSSLFREAYTQYRSLQKGQTR